MSKRRKVHTPKVSDAADVGPVAVSQTGDGPGILFVSDEATGFPPEIWEAAEAMLGPAHPGGLPDAGQLASEIRAAPVVLPARTSFALPTWEYQETTCYADELAAHAAEQGAAGWRLAWGREDRRQATRDGVPAQWRTCVLLWERAALPAPPPAA